MRMKILDYVGPTHNADGQITVSYDQHKKALRSPSGVAWAIAGMLAGWAEYAKNHKERYASTIGDDYVLGPAWAEAGFAIKRLLDGETGGLDCGSLSRNIVSAIEEQGFKTDGYTILD